MISACSYASTTIHLERGQPLRWFGRDTPKWMRTVSQRVGFETFGGASRIRGRGVSKFSLKMGKKTGLVVGLGVLSTLLRNSVSKRSNVFGRGSKMRCTTQACY